METNKKKAVGFLCARDEQCPRPFPKLSRNSLSKFKSAGHLHLGRVGRKQVDTFNASPPYHQIKMIHRPCRNICTYTRIHASKTWLGLCARCSRGGRWLGLVAITTATILASAPMHAEAPVPCGFVLRVARGSRLS